MLLLGVVAATHVAAGLHEGAGVLHVAACPDAAPLGLVPAAALLQVIGSVLNLHTTYQCGSPGRSGRESLLPS